MNTICDSKPENEMQNLKKHNFKTRHPANLEALLFLALNSQRAWFQFSLTL